MNKYQKIVAIIYIVVLVGLLLFPPFRITYDGQAIFKGFKFIFSRPEAYTGIDSFQLLVQFIFVTAIFGVGWFLFKEKTKN